MEEIREKLKRARSIAVLTGAGVSAESGIPTFRGPGGLWRQFRPEELANPAAFLRDPKLVWEWYDWRRALIAKAQPNAGHRALAELQSRSKRFTLITQNVGDLHERAGSLNVLHVHGSIWTVRCLDCRHESENRLTPLPELPPPCPDCGGLLRLGVVWFGESLPRDVWRRAEEESRTVDVFLVVGTSLQVFPAAGLAHMAAASGARVVEINLDTETGLKGPSGEILPQLIA